MTTFVRSSVASSILGAFALFLAGCGGGGGGATVPTATPIGTPSGTVTPTTPPTGGTPVTANQVAFVSNRANPSGDNSDLYKSNLDGTNVVRLTNVNQPVDKPSVSTDGARLIFQFGESNENGGNNNIEIGLINTNGTGFQPLTNDDTDGGRPDDYNPVFSPNAQYIYWTSTRRATDASGAIVDGVPHIWRMRGSGLVGAEQQQLVSEASAYPSVDNQGNIAYLALGQNGGTLKIRSTSGSERTIGGTITGQVFDLALSPDGTRLAVSVGSGTDETASSQIRIFNVTSGNPDGASPSGGSSNGGSAWSRNSQTLFFDAASGASSRRQIFSSVSPFSTRTQISQDATSDNYSPAFLPGS